MLRCWWGTFCTPAEGKGKRWKSARKTARSLSRLHGRRAHGRTSFSQQQQQQQSQQQLQKWELGRQQHRDLQQQLQQPQQKQQREQQQEQQQSHEYQNREQQRTVTTTIVTTTILDISSTTRPPSRIVTAPRGNKTINISKNRGRWNKTMGGVRQRINYKRYRPVPMTPDNATYYSPDAQVDP